MENWETLRRNIKKQENYFNKTAGSLADYFDQKNTEDRAETTISPYFIPGKGKYFYSEEYEEILQVIKHKGELLYCDLKGSNMGASTVSTPKKNKFIETTEDIICLGSSLVTGEKVYGKEISTTDNCSKIVILHSNETITVPSITKASRGLYFFNGTIYTYADLYCSTINSSKKSIIQKIEEGYTIENSYHCDGFDHDKFYCFAHYCRKLISVPAHSIEDLTYALIENILFVKGDYGFRKFTITENSIPLQKGYFARFDNGKLILEKEIFCKYPKFYNADDKLHYKNESWIIDEINLFPITDEIRNTDKILTIKNHFVVFRDEMFFKFHKINSNNIKGDYIPEVSTFFKPLKYNRKNTSFWIYDNTLYICDLSYGYKLNLEKYLKIRMISEKLCEITNLKGKKFFINNYGYIYSFLFDEKTHKTVKTVSSRYGFFIISKNTNLESYDIQFNNKILNLKNKTLSYEGFKIDNVVLNLERNRFEFSMHNNRLNNYADTAILMLDNPTSYSLQNSTTILEDSKYLFEVILNNEYILFTKMDSAYTTNYSVKEKEDLSNIIKINDTFLCIKGYTLQNSFVSACFDKYNSLIRKINRKLSYLEENLSLKKLTSFLNSITIRTIFEEYAERGIALNLQFIKENLNSRDFIDTTLYLSNIEKHLSKKNFLLFKELVQNKVNNKTYESTELINSLNLSNSRLFSLNNLSLDKLNSFKEEINFTAYAGGKGNLKSVLESDLIIQIENLIGSKKRKTPGVFNITRLNDYKEFHNYMLNDTNFKIKLLKNLDQNKTIKTINKIGYSLFKYLKGEGIYADMNLRTITIANKSFNEIPLDKIKSIFLKLSDKIDYEMDKLKNWFNKDDYYIYDTIVPLIDFIQNHLKESYTNIPSDFDIKSADFKIRCWEREDIFRSINQGTRTHCCVAASSSGVSSMMEYILNKNIILVEISSSNKVIGQAFVYIGRTDKELDYGYQYKYHNFLVIDNVEINNNYATFSKEIAINLTKFMSKFKNFLGDSITDVLLGTRYNDITPPYTFTSFLRLNIVGKELYTDNGGDFYKFI